MSKRSIFVIAVAAIAGCGGAGEFDDGGIGPAKTVSGAQSSHSGTRLKQRWFKNDDGSQAEAGWFDTKLHTTCTMTDLGNGFSACLPPDIYTQNTGDGEAINIPAIYADASCEQAIGMVAYDAPPCLSYGLIYVAAPSDGEAQNSSCGATYSEASYQLIAPVDPSTTAIYILGIPPSESAGGVCCTCYQATAQSAAASGETAAYYRYEEMNAANLAALPIVAGQIVQDN